jgi:hypothetical protein
VGGPGFDRNLGDPGLERNLGGPGFERNLGDLMSVQKQVWSRYHGEAFDLDLLGPEGENPSGFTMSWTWAEYPLGPAILTIDGSSITTSGPDDDDRYTITVPHTRSQTGVTLNRDLYFVDLWRTDTGEEVRLAGGQFTLSPPVRSQT